ncbi:MAG: hypothetical protein ACE5HC_15305 [Candidatus Binatia bacterium]
MAGLKKQIGQLIMVGLVGESYLRIQGLKKHYLASFRGVREAEIEACVGLPDHRKIIEEI